MKLVHLALIPQNFLNWYAGIDIAAFCIFMLQMRKYHRNLFSQINSNTERCGMWIRSKRHKASHVSMNA